MANIRFNENKKHLKLIRDWIDPYFQISSLHGLRYLSKLEDMPKSHRFIWIVKIALTVILCVWMLMIFKNHYEDTHTIITIETNTYPVGSIWFPSVTICNVNRVSRRNFKNISDILTNGGVQTSEIEDFAQSLEYLSSLSTFDYEDRDVNNHIKIFDILKSHNYTMDKIMEEVHQKCGELLYMCMFKTDFIDCTKYFKTIKSMEGYCCSFNYHGPGQLDNSTPSMEIEKVSSYGLSNGITAVLNINPDDYMSPSKPLHGAVVLISDPIDYPEMGIKSTFVQLNGAVQVLVTPTIISSTRDVKKLPIKARGCKFPNEIKGKSYYSLQSCLMECKIKAIHDMCNCIPYFYPNDGYHRTCVLKDLECLLKYNAFFNDISPMDELDSNGMGCDCMPECFATSYSISILQKPIKKSYFFSQMRNVSFVNKSIISVAYPKSICIKYIRDVYLHWNDAFSMQPFCGGIFSLCIGGSIISVVELIYEFILKSLTCKPKREHNKVPFIN